MNAFWLLAVLIPLFTSGGGRGVASASAIAPFDPDFFVSATGSALNPGTEALPWSLQYAFDSAPAGSDVEILGGTYNAAIGTEWLISGSGTIGAPRRFRARRGERVTLDSLDTGIVKKVVKFTGNHNWLWDVEAKFTASTNRVSVDTGDEDNPNDIGGRGAKSVAFHTGFGNKIINSVVHDTGNGLGAADECYDIEIYGCLGYNGGWVGPIRGNGHSLYSQNENALGQLIEDYVSYGFFSSGVKVGGSSAAWVRYFTLRGLASFNHGNHTSYGAQPSCHIQGGSDHGSDGIGYDTVEDCSWFNSQIALSGGNNPGIFEFGQPGVSARWAIYRRNISVGLVYLSGWSEQYTCVDNKGTLLVEDFPFNGQGVLWIRIDDLGGQTYATHTVNRNSWAGKETNNPFRRFLSSAGGGSNGFSFANWKTETGYEADGSSANALSFTGADVVYRPNKYEAGRAWIYCHNWGKPQVTGVAATDVLNKVAHGFANGQRHAFARLEGGVGLALDTVYFVVNKTDDTFQLSDTEGGAAVNFTTDITDAILVPERLDVDLAHPDLGSSAFAIGENYEIHQVYDVDCPNPASGDAVASGTYAGGTISLNQVGYIAPNPIGWTGDPPPSSSPLFNVFLLRKV